MSETLPIVEERQVVSSDNVGVVLSLENLIKEHIQSISTLTEEKKKKNEMYKDSFENSPVYRENAEKARLASGSLRITKSEITKQPQMVKLNDEVKDLSSQIKERKLALSDYLLEYQRITQATQLELFDGDTVEIVKSARVVRSRRKK